MIVEIKYNPYITSNKCELISLKDVSDMELTPSQSYAIYEDGYYMPLRGTYIIDSKWSSGCPILIHKEIEEPYMKFVREIEREMKLNRILNEL